MPECLESVFDKSCDCYFGACDGNAYVNKCIFRIVSGNNTNKSESDQEDNDDVNDNDWSYGAEKKGESPFFAIFQIESLNDSRDFTA